MTSNNQQDTCDCSAKYLTLFLNITIKCDKILYQHLKSYALILKSRTDMQFRI